ncbi:tetratricopeptide repeat protein [Phytohabitans suffuscus]|uniref:hypothetical protein n=1 Tax=Phytohabitans suffuscus TaxID=624315 RepID=UPI001567B574|nr:hypothetical protein [Phytohabitans suffuscus]
MAIARAMSFYAPALQLMVSSATPPDRIEPYVTILGNAIDAAVDIESPHFAAYAEALVELLTAVGGPTIYPDRLRILDLVGQASVRLSRNGQPTTDLRLAAARLCAAISNGGQQRLSFIRAAIDEGKDTSDKFRATLVLAQFYIDTSRYRRAHHALDLCERLAVGNVGYTAHTLTTRGLIYFYYAPRRALRYFERAIAVGRASDQVDAIRASATALHFIGRIHAARCEYTLALTFLMAAQLVRSDLPTERKPRGFYELRMAEVLLDAGQVKEAQWHIAQAAMSLQTVHEISTAEAMLNGVLARIAAMQNNSEQAEQLLRIAIEVAQRDDHPRGELVFLASLLRLRARRGMTTNAIFTLLHVTWLYLGAHPFRGGARLASRVLRGIGRSSAALCRRGMGGTSRGTRCPCEYHASHDSGTELLAAIRSAEPTRSIRRIASKI